MSCLCRITTLCVVRDYIILACLPDSRSHIHISNVACLPPPTSVTSQTMLCLIQFSVLCAATLAAALPTFDRLEPRYEFAPLSVTMCLESNLKGDCMTFVAESTVCSTPSYLHSRFDEGFAYEGADIMDDSQFATAKSVKTPQDTPCYFYWG